ncbi:MAG TPA: cytochrome c oxidase subunit II transmembrane domain-containing protein [Candidatus Caenarcaniphilales bacterium]
MKIPSNISTLIAGVALTLISLWYGHNHNLLPAAASEEAPLVDGIFNVMLTIGTGIFLLVQGVLIVSVVLFRRRQNDNTDGPPVHGNIPLEIFWTAIPAVIVLAIAIYSFDVYRAEGGKASTMGHAMAHVPASLEQVANLPGIAMAAPLPPLVETAPAAEIRNQQKQDEAIQDPATAAVRNTEVPQRREAPGAGVVSPGVGATPKNQGQAPEVDVNVTGLQFAWIFTYPDTGITSGELHLPVGQEVKLNISANDVIHAFWVPEFRLKQDAFPGRQTELRFTPSKVGEYRIVCAELCGAYHGAMKSQVIVQTPEDFNSWLREQQVASREALDQAVAVNPVTADPLSTYATEVGVESEALNQLRTASLGPLSQAAAHLAR